MLKKIRLHHWLTKLSCSFKAATFGLLNNMENKDENGWPYLHLWMIDAGKNSKLWTTIKDVCINEC